MKGNISKVGIKGDKGYTPHITFRYDEKTGDLFYSSDDMFVDSDYISTHELVDKQYINDYIEQLRSDISPSKAFVNILGGDNNWVPEDVYANNNNVIGVRYGQTVNVNNAVVTPNSQVDLQITSEQMAIFYEKDLAFVAENEEGVVTIYCIGSVPQNDYTIQVTVTEVVLDA